MVWLRLISTLSLSAVLIWFEPSLEKLVIYKLIRSFQQNHARKNLFLEIQKWGYININLADRWG